MRRRAFTLIEMLALVLILGLASGLTLGITGLRSGSTRTAAIGALSEALERARLLAARSGGAEVCFGEMISICACGGSQPLRQATLPMGWSALLITAPGHANADSLFIDTTGCSSDARMVLRGPMATSCTLALRGVSGELVLVDEESLSHE